MRLGLARSLVGCAALCMVAACSGGMETGKVNLEAAKTSEIHADKTMSADTLTSMGEILLTPSSYMQAQRLFQAALEKDPGHFKAGLYDKILKVALPLKGIMGQQNSALLNSYGVTSLEGKSLRNFFENSSGPQWRTASDVQDTVAAHRDALIDLYQFLSEHDEVTEVKISSWAFVDDVDQDWQIEGDLDSQMVARCNDCVGGAIPFRTLNHADLIALRQLIGGYSLYTIMATTYDLGQGFYSGTEMPTIDTLVEWIAQGRVEGDSEKGLLRADNRIDFLGMLGPDTVSAIRWARENSATLCTERSGNIFEKGICLSKDLMEMNLNGMAEAFSGPSEISTSAGQVAINLAAFIDNPIQDFLQPFDLSKADLRQCGNVFNILADSTLGGIFVNGDVDRFAEDCRDHHNR